ncbi:cytochrome c oxidase assembly protein [Virgibacillus kekensis]|uniref:Cytochrome c oxidase assembly protein n=1 Tax=Virgibacillus kekensis TaxID=202261 RepID=A0ABV9DQN1_9BACI
MDEFQLLLAIPFLLLLFGYIFAVITANRKHRPWPVYRVVLLILGITCALISVIGPLANLAMMDFEMHMLTHLLLGMLAPLLIVLAAPTTLLLRALPVPKARRLSRLLRSRLFGVYTNPIVTTILNVGGLWLLYTTNLYSLMHENMVVHVLIMMHVFIAGYLFTASFIYIDPNPHRYSYFYRSIVFIIALAGHGILAKFIYAHPPADVTVPQAEDGAILMYYGGDFIDAAIIIILCYHWYRNTQPRPSTTV